MTHRESETVKSMYCRRGVLLRNRRFISGCLWAVAQKRGARKREAWNFYARKQQQQKCLLQMFYRSVTAVDSFVSDHFLTPNTVVQHPFAPCCPKSDRKALPLGMQTRPRLNLFHVQTEGRDKGRKDLWSTKKCFSKFREGNLWKSFFRESLVSLRWLISGMEGNSLYVWTVK